MKKFSKKKKKKIIISALIFIGSMILIGLIIMYIKNINLISKKITDETTHTYILNKSNDGTGGLYVANIEDDLKEYVKKHKKAQDITYKIKGEDFYFNVGVSGKGDDFKVQINKIVDEKRNISARMTYKNVKSVEYRTGGTNDSTILNIITEYDNKYMAITNDNYYFLGNDIDKVSYENEHFYYYTINPAYLILESVNECSNEVVAMVEGFSYSDYYSTYGVVNFLKDYYQKLNPTSNTVWEKCLALQNKYNESVE